MIDPDFLTIAAMVLGPSGAAYAGVKASVNGMRGQVTEIRDDVKDLQRGQARTGERLAAVETKLEAMQ